MPALRRLSIVNVRVFEWLFRKERWATNLLPQLDSLEIGEDLHADADVRLLVPLAYLPTFVRLVVGAGTRRPGHFDKLLGILALLPNLELLLIPLSFWSPPAPQPHVGSARAPSRRAVQQAAQRQRAVVAESARRGVALRTYDEREGEGEGSVPEFEQFLRERASAAAGSGT